MGAAAIWKGHLLLPRDLIVKCRLTLTATFKILILGWIGVFDFRNRKKRTCRIQLTTLIVFLKYRNGHFCCISGEGRSELRMGKRKKDGKEKEYRASQAM